MSLAFQVRARRDAFVLDVAFETDARLIAVVGPSGAGKTTLLEGLAGLGRVDAARLVVNGDVLVDTASGLNPPPHQRGLGYVFQDGRLFPHLSVGANVGFSRPYVADPLPVAEALRLVDLEGFETRWPRSLSGGEARRVAVARALAARARLLLLDEPFTGLDGPRRAALVDHFRRLRDRVGTPILIVTHDERDVADLAEGILTIVDGRQPVGNETFRGDRPLR